MYKIASRGSALALWQLNFAKEQLSQAGISSETLIVKTSGDKFQNTPLHEIGGKGVFVKELEQALISKQADFAVHSLKDLPAQTREPFALPCYFPRDPSEDLMIFNPTWKERLKSANSQAWNADDVRALGPLKVGTGSLRREALLHEVNSKIKTVAIRGNVDTRLKRLKDGEWDAIILSKAALHRLSIADEFPCFTLDASWFVPCAGQGVIVVETLQTHPLVSELKKLSDHKTETTVSIERKVLAFLGGDCNVPIGVHVFYKDHELCCDLAVFNSEGEVKRMYLTQDASSDFAEMICEELQNSKIKEFIDS